MPEHCFQRESITSSFLQPDERSKYQTPKKGFKAHQTRRRQECRQNSSALRTAALERARLALSGDLHEDENVEVRAVLPVVQCSVVYLCSQSSVHNHADVLAEAVELSTGIGRMIHRYTGI